MNTRSLFLLLMTLPLAVGLRSQDVPVEAAPPPAEVPVTPAAPEAPLSPEAPVAPEAPEPPPPPRPPSPARPREVVVMGGDALLAAGESARQVVAIFGNAIVDGSTTGDVVAILGDATVNGEARKTVAVLGNVTVNGTVRGDVVAVLGGVQLGPTAVVTGEVVAIGGGVDRAPGAVVNRGINQIGFFKGKMPALDGIKAWIRHCLVLGRPLAFADNLGWAWMLAGGFLAFYLLLALVFGRAVEKCAETLEQQPGLTVATSFLTLLLIPVLTVLLAITGVGPLILAFAGMAGTLFGKAAFLTWMGRRITQPLGLRAPVLAALFGGVLLLAFYLIPYVGFVVWKVSGVLGLGMVVYTVILALKRERRAPAATPPVPPPLPSVPPVPATATGFTAPLESVAPTGHAFAAPIPPVTAGSAATLPRAGFWIRLAATGLDFVIIGLVAAMVGAYFVPIFAVYCFVLWALKGTTVGGIVCGLKLVRLDGRELDWKIALVRCLGAFLSLVVAGLGFIWVAFDDECQSWHDKIAGTTIVRVPRGTPLV